MKYLFVYVILTCSFFIACNDTATQNPGTKRTNGKEKDEKKKNVSKRDKSIDSSNSYSDLFLDSLAMEDFITSGNIPDSVSPRIRSFYNARNYQFAWFTADGLTEQALGFWNLSNYAIYLGDTTLKNTALQKKMGELLSEDTLRIKASDKTVIQTEFLLTQHFIEYSLDNYEKGFVKRKELERFIPLKKEEAMVVADSLLTKKHKDDKYFDEINASYKALKGELSRYLKISQSGGWPFLPADAKQYKKGVASPQVALLKKRLRLSGDMDGQDSSNLFNDTLEAAIKRFQQSFGYTMDGKVSSVLLKDLNVPVEQRVEQILINLNRIRWMPQEPQGKLILVNIPEFTLHVLDGNNKIFDMNVVVGKEGHNTMMFTGKLSQVVFSPYWNVPSSIVKKEILPKMKANPRYLASQRMEVTGTEDGLPKVRQLPGEKNSLGKVKFLFPNSYDIYFHDTPAKDLFSKDKRAYSHGCIRLSDPLKMAEYVLKDDSNWPPDKIIEAMNAAKEQTVKVKDPIPVFITYYTAWVDENGLLNFRDDIYGRDAEVAKRMFQK